MGTPLKSKATKHKRKGKSKAGRPPKLTPETVKKLEEAFAIDATVEEACFYAEISRQTYYTWVGDNPALHDRFESLRNRPVLLARQTVVKALVQPEYAFKYLEKKRKREFGAAVDVTTGGEKITGINYIVPNGTDPQTDVEAAPSV